MARNITYSCVDGNVYNFFFRESDMESKYSTRIKHTIHGL
jgi:hypothetical protein